MTIPKLTFFCEMKSLDLQAAFTPAVIDTLKTLRAGLSLGLLDLSPQRAEVVRRLNQAGVPVTAWLLLPRQQGYWFNLENAPQAAACYSEFKNWSAVHALQWEAVGIDLELDRRDMEIFAAGPWRLVPRVVRRLRQRGQLQAAERAYADLVRQMRSDGFRVESYIHPFIADERKAGSRFLRRAAGMVDVAVDREVWMLYTSLFRPHGVGLLGSYGPEADAIAVGVTGGGVNSGVGDPRPLSWQELGRDLRLAWYWSDRIYLFSLEGCLQQGFLERLSSFTWDEPFLLPEESTSYVDTLRQAWQSFLWLSAHAGAILLGAGTGLALLWGLRRYWRCRIYPRLHD